MKEAPEPNEDAEADQKPAMLAASQRNMIEFIGIYQLNPCLWKYSCKDYRNREAKERAYEALVEKMREIDPRADKTCVMRKINAMRTAFRREWKKTRRANLLARASANTRYPRRGKYVSSLWYYDLLRFVVEQQDFADRQDIVASGGALLTDWNEEQHSGVVENDVADVHVDRERSEAPGVVCESYSSVDEDGKVVSHSAETFMEYLEDTPSMQHTEVKLEPTSPTSSRPGSPTHPQSHAINSQHNVHSLHNLNNPNNPTGSIPTLNLEINAVYSERANVAVPSSSSNRRDEPTTTIGPIAWRTRRGQQQQHQQSESSELPDKAPTEQTMTTSNYRTRRRAMAQQQVQAREQTPEAAAPGDLDRFGAYVVSKLKRSSPKQCIIAEKVIADVLMRANLGTLEETTMLSDFKVTQSSV